VSHDEEVETVFLEFESELSVGEETLFINYMGTLNDQLRGFYRSQYTIDGEERFLAVTLFEVCPLCVVL
jgi:puromycin-sensitive aminopeptidase